MSKKKLSSVTNAFIFKKYYTNAINMQLTKITKLWEDLMFRKKAFETNL